MSMPAYDFSFTSGNPAPAATISGELLTYTPLALLWQGRSAVMLFFVLSGFLLSLPWWRARPQSYPVFLIRRVTRIYLPYLVAIGAAAALMGAFKWQPLPGMSAWFNSGWERPLSTEVVLQHLAMIGDGGSIDGSVWSLFYEMKISLIFPALMTVALAFDSRGMVACVAALGAVYGLEHMLHAREDWIVVDGQMVAFVALFVLGATCARNLTTIAATCARGPTWLPTLLLVVGLLLRCPLYSRKTMIQAVPLGLGSALVICTVLLPGRVNAVLQRPVPLWLGRVSFSLYLIHMPIILATVRLTYSVVPAPVALVFSAGLSLMAAEWFHRTVEWPCQRLGRRLTIREVRATELAGP